MNVKVISRRSLLTGGALLTSLGLYSYQRGLRYPRLSFEHEAVSSTLSAAHLNLSFKDCIAVNDNTLRAIAPEPSVTIKLTKGSSSFEINNIANNAILDINQGRAYKGSVDQQVQGIRRQVYIESGGEQTLTLKWTVPNSNGFEFAVMGDTGGGAELTWTLKRAHQLGAQFLLHLGDFNYSEGEYDSAIDQFNNAKLPCYVTIGNHDFHDNGLIYDKFLKQIGPMNHAFELAGTRFINLDTAADFWPKQSGQRGHLLRILGAQAPFLGEQILFTHRPMKDPRPHDDHDIGGIGEIDWLARQARHLGVSTILNGHVHHSAEIDFQGLRQLTIGEGLGHEDLVLQKPVAKIMMAKVEPGRKLEQRWEELNMPWSEHLSPTHLIKLKRDGRNKQLEWYQAILAANGVT
ncbi:MAG: putative phosphodiesterase [Arenicella sp.]